MVIQAPEKGDLVYIDFNPQAGHEQAGRRPAVVLSPKKFNEVTGFVSICPITNTIKGWGYEVALPNDAVFKGVILTDQIKNLDWQARKVQIKGQVSHEIVKQCIEKIQTYLYD